MKKCSKCGEIKEVLEFYKRSDGDGYQSLCKVCMKKCRQVYRSDPVKRKREYEGRRQHRKNNSDYYKVMDRKQNLQRNFGISVEQYEALLAAQNNVCAICKKPERAILNGKIKNLAVDHCHKTGKIRGLLCCACNRGVGMFNEDEKLCFEAASYLKNFCIPE